MAEHAGAKVLHFPTELTRSLLPSEVNACVEVATSLLRSEALGDGALSMASFTLGSMRVVAGEDPDVEDPIGVPIHRLVRGATEIAYGELETSHPSLREAEGVGITAARDAFLDVVFSD